jgi:hypothetical protein
MVAGSDPSVRFSNQSPIAVSLLRVNRLPRSAARADLATLARAATCTLGCMQRHAPWQPLPRRLFHDACHVILLAMIAIMA